jgi:hypothetical protein
VCAVSNVMRAVAADFFFNCGIWRSKFHNFYVFCCHVTIENRKFIDQEYDAAFLFIICIVFLFIGFLCTLNFRIIKRIYTSTSIPVIMVRWVIF